MCYEVLGFDIFLDNKLKAWLIEVNHSPSFTTDTPLDNKIKYGIIKDVIHLLNLSVKRKMRYIGSIIFSDIRMKGDKSFREG
jgi:tubulin polyglutamylase TTLL6/13